jgi:hypothetical protein
MHEHAEKPRSISFLPRPGVALVGHVMNLLGRGGGVEAAPHAGDDDDDEIGGGGGGGRVASKAAAGGAIDDEFVVVDSVGSGISLLSSGQVRCHRHRERQSVQSYASTPLS